MAGPQSWLCVVLDTPQGGSEQGGIVAIGTRLRQPGFGLFELISDAILAVEQQGVMAHANRQPGGLFGREPATLISAPSRD
jgi:hypothetical protein